jgi:hypothetical protein
MSGLRICSLDIVAFPTGQLSQREKAVFRVRGKRFELLRGEDLFAKHRAALP